MKIGIYGGTFNPPHLGHMVSARYAMEALGLDRLFFVPAGMPPHKSLPKGSPATRQRLEMAELAVDALLLPVILPFNLLKGALVAVLTALIYKRVSVIIKSV